MDRWLYQLSDQIPYPVASNPTLGEWCIITLLMIAGKGCRCVCVCVWKGGGGMGGGGGALLKFKLFRGDFICFSLD